MLWILSSRVGPRNASVTAAYTLSTLVCFAATTGPPFDNLLDPRPGGPSAAEYLSIEAKKSGYILASMGCARPRSFGHSELI